MVIDSIHGFIATNASVSIEHAIEDTFRGYIEFMASFLRMYYAANGPPGTIPVNGTYTVWRVGYRGQPVVLGSLVPPLALITALAIYYLTIGIRSGSTNVPLPSFDPVDSLSILLAGAAGKSTGTLPTVDARRNSVPDKHLLKRMTVRFESDTGYVVAHGKNPSVQEVELGPMISEVPPIHVNHSGRSTPEIQPEQFNTSFLATGTDYSSRSTPEGQHEEFNAAYLSTGNNYSGRSTPEGQPEQVNASFLSHETRAV